MEQIDQISETLMPVVLQYGLQVIGAILMLVIGWAAANWLAGRTKKYLSRSSRFDETVTPLFVKTVKILVIIITILAVLSNFGVQTASIIAVLGTIGLAIGLALQGTLSNIASGILLLILRPFNVGDVVNIGGTTGVVDEIGLFVTYMHTFDNIAIVMPNSRVWSNVIEIFTANATRRVDMEFGISYEDDMDKAMSIIKEVLDADERVLEEPEPLIAVGTLADSSVNILVRPWTHTENVWPLRYAIIKTVKERFEAEGITFPFPQRDVHVDDNSEPMQ